MFFGGNDFIEQAVWSDSASPGVFFASNFSGIPSIRIYR